MGIQEDKAKFDRKFFDVAQFDIKLDIGRISVKFSNLKVRPSRSGVDGCRPAALHDNWTIQVAPAPPSPSDLHLPHYS